MKNSFLVILFTMFVTVIWAKFLIASESDIKLDLKIVPLDEVTEVFSDSQATVVDEVKEDIYVNRYYEDGVVTSIRDKKKLTGIWFIDTDGQHCIRWNKKDTSNCGVIMQDDEGNWVKVKKDRILKSYESIEKLPSDSKKY